MNYEEFKARTTEKASYETFQRFEKMYMAGDIDKDVFCKLMKPLVVAITEAAPFEATEKAERNAMLAALSKANRAAEDGNLAAFDEYVKDARGNAERKANAKAEIDRIYAKL